MKKAFLINLMILLGFLSNTYASESNGVYSPSPENIEARKWFQDAKFGIFLHWGVYSVLAGGGDTGAAEWIMENKQIPIKQYENLLLAIIARIFPLIDSIFQGLCYRSDAEQLLHSE